MAEKLSLVGYLDDEIDCIMYKKFIDSSVDIENIENCSSLKDVVDWILINRAESLVVDFDLSSKYDFQGTDVVSYINKNLPDFPCIVLTSHKDDSVQTNLVLPYLIKERSDLESDVDKIYEFGKDLEQACNVFKARLKLRHDEFDALYAKKQNKTISSEEEYILKQVYTILRAYEEVDEIPAEWLESEMSQQIDSLLKMLDNCVNKED